MEWISVKDRLPEQLISCLVFIENQNFIAHGTLERDFTWTACYTGDEIKEWDNNKGVTHWMPLPEPPKK